MLFSKARLAQFKDELEHRENFKLIGQLAPKLGILEIVTRNKIAGILRLNDDVFVSQQTFGFWAKTIHENKIHNQLLNLKSVDFRKYSRFNKKANFLNFEKVKITYDLALKIRNRAFHFENMLKVYANDKPRISTKIGNKIVGIDPDKFILFIDDILECYQSGLSGYLQD